MGDGGGVEFAVGGGYDGFVVVYVERKVVDFLAAQSVYVALDHGVVAYLFVLVDFDAQSVGEGAGCVGKRGLRPEAGGASAVKCLCIQHLKIIMFFVYMFSPHILSLLPCIRVYI